MASRNDFKQFAKDAKKVIKGLPRMMGKVALLQASDNFRRQGAENEAGQVVPWAPRKDGHGRTRKDGGRDRRYRHRALLVKTGRLRRSPRIVQVTATSVTVGTDVAYAQPLNDGTSKMPARPFLVVGKSGREQIIRKAAADISALLSR